MAIDCHPAAEALPKECAHAAHLLDDIGDGDVGAQIIADYGHRNAALIGPARHLAERGRLQRAPPAAVDKDRKRRMFMPFGQEKIDSLACRTAVSQAKLSAVAFEHLGPVKLRF